MPRIRGKVAEALNEAREWIEASKHEIAELETMLVKARMQLEMHETVYNVLEKTLTRQPRQSSSKSHGGMARAVSNSLKSASKSTTRRTSLCVHRNPDGEVCEASASSSIHDSDSPSGFAHAFTPVSKSTKKAR